MSKTGAYAGAGAVLLWISRIQRDWRPFLSFAFLSFRTRDIYRFCTESLKWNGVLPLTAIATETNRKEQKQRHEEHAMIDARCGQWNTHCKYSDLFVIEWVSWYDFFEVGDEKADKIVVERMVSSMHPYLINTPPLSSGIWSSVFVLDAITILSLVMKTIYDLPPEMLDEIFGYLSLNDKLRMRAVSTIFLPIFTLLLVRWRSLHGWTTFCFPLSPTLSRPSNA